MNVKDELHLFMRYNNLFNCGDLGRLAISSVHLAQQLEPYINRTLDLGWIIRCILDINSNNLFSLAREDSNTYVSNERHPEYKYAKFLIQLCSFMMSVTDGKSMSLDEATRKSLDENSKFYFGKELSELHDQLLKILCEELHTFS